MDDTQPVMSNHRRQVLLCESRPHTHMDTWSLPVVLGQLALKGVGEILNTVILVSGRWTLVLCQLYGVI